MYILRMKCLFYFEILIYDRSYLGLVNISGTISGDIINYFAQYVDYNVGTNKLMFVALSSFVFGLNYDPSLITYYSFESNTINNLSVKNLATGVYDLTLTNTNMIINGIIGNAMSANSSSYGTITQLPATGNNGISVSLWMNKTGNCTNSFLYVYNWSNNSLNAHFYTGDGLETYINGTWYYLTGGNFSSNVWSSRVW